MSRFLRVKKRPISLKRDLYRSKETCINKRRMTNILVMHTTHMRHVIHNYHVSTSSSPSAAVSSAVTIVTSVGWLRLVGSLKSWVSFAKEPYKRDVYSLKRRVILRGLLIVATAQQVRDRIVGTFKL